MLNLVMTALAALLSAILMHGMVIFLIPQIGADTMVSVVQTATGGRDTIAIDDQKLGLPDIAYSDPAFRHFACSYDLEGGPYRVTARGRAEFWSLAVFDEANTNQFSFSSDGNETAELDFVIATQQQKNILADIKVDLSERTIIAIVPNGEGAVVLRIFRPDASYDLLIKELSTSFDCTQLELKAPA